MRVVRSPRGADDRLGVDASAVRDLPSRFPAANLVPLSLVRAPALDRRADGAGRVRVWLALESLQVTGSFKVRGALVAIADAKGKIGPDLHVVAASAGNHGAGVAYAARVLGVRATVVVPASAPLAKRARIEAEGARLVLAKGPHYDDAEGEAIALARDTGAVFLSPYDDPLVAAGNGGSLGLEIARALGKDPEVVLCPFGGGGLASGLGWALGPRRARVWGVQSEASPAMALSLERGSAVTALPPTEETLAEGLEGGISVSGFERARKAIDGVVVVLERDIASAMSFAVKELGLVLEGSSAVALVPVLEGLPTEILGALPASDALETGVDAVVVLTGRNVDRDRLLRLPPAGG